MIYDDPKSDSSLNYYYVMDFDKVAHKTDEFKLKLANFSETARKITKATMLVMVALIFAYRVITDIGIVLSNCH